MTLFKPRAGSVATLAILAATLMTGLSGPAAAASDRNVALINKMIHALDAKHVHKGHRHYRRKHGAGRYGYRYGRKRYGGYKRKHARHYGRHYHPVYRSPALKHYEHYGVRAPRGHGLRLDVFFAYGSASFGPKARHALDALGHALSDPRLEGKRFLIAGHTDAAGRAYVNQQLSEARAIAIKRYLVHTFGIEPYRLVAVGFGEEHLYDPHAPYDGVNRRVEIKPLTRAVHDQLTAESRY